MALLEENMSEQTQATLENRFTEAADLCVNELGLKMPLNVVTIDMGGISSQHQFMGTAESSLLLIRVEVLPLRCIRFTLL